MMVLGFLVSLYVYILRPGTAQALARAFPGLYQFLLNKWYFDELYDFLFVRPAFALGGCSGRAETVGSSTGSDPMAWRRVVDGASSPCVFRRIHLSLCFRDVDRRRGGRQLFVAGGMR